MSSFPTLHPWTLTPAEARALQTRLARRVITSDDVGPLDAFSTVAGVDVGFEDGGDVTRAAVVVLDLPTLEPIAWSLVRRPTTFPYVPGLLSFRELPAVLDALEELDDLPDAVLVDGQGLAHPRRFGIACHLGVWTGLPTVGVAKSLLVGQHGPLPDEKGAWVPLEHRGEGVGAALRSRAGVQPIYLSVGHRLGLATAIELTLRCLTRYKLPETTRAAHRLASHGIPPG